MAYCGPAGQLAEKVLRQRWSMHLARICDRRSPLHCQAGSRRIEFRISLSRDTRRTLAELSSLSAGDRLAGRAHPEERVNDALACHA